MPLLWYFSFTVVVVVVVVVVAAAVVVAVEVDIRLRVTTCAEGTAGYLLGESISLRIYVVDDRVAGYLNGDSADDLGPTDDSNSRAWLPLTSTANVLDSRTPMPVI